MRCDRRRSTSLKFVNFLKTTATAVVAYAMVGRSESQGTHGAPPVNPAPAPVRLDVSSGSPTTAPAGGLGASVFGTPGNTATWADGFSATSSAEVASKPAEVRATPLAASSVFVVAAVGGNETASGLLASGQTSTRTVQAARAAVSNLVAVASGLSTNTAPLSSGDAQTVELALGRVRSAVDDLSVQMLDYELAPAVRRKALLELVVAINESVSRAPSLRFHVADRTASYRQMDSRQVAFVSLLQKAGLALADAMWAATSREEAELIFRVIVSYRSLLDTYASNLDVNSPLIRGLNAVRGPLSSVATRVSRPMSKEASGVGASAVPPAAAPPMADVIARIRRNLDPLAVTAKQGAMAPQADEGVGGVQLDSARLAPATVLGRWQGALRYFQKAIGSTDDVGKLDALAIALGNLAGVMTTTSWDPTTQQSSFWPTKPDKLQRDFAARRDALVREANALQRQAIDKWRAAGGAGVENVE